METFGRQQRRTPNRQPATCHGNHTSISLMGAVVAGSGSLEGQGAKLLNHEGGNCMGLQIVALMMMTGMAAWGSLLRALRGIKGRSPWPWIWMSAGISWWCWLGCQPPCSCLTDMIADSPPSPASGARRPRLRLGAGPRWVIGAAASHFLLDEGSAPCGLASSASSGCSECMCVLTVRSGPDAAGGGGKTETTDREVSG